MKRMFYVLICLVLALPLAATEPVEIAMLERVQEETAVIVDEAQVRREGVDAAVLHFLGGSKRHPLSKPEKRAEFVETVIQVSDERGVPERLIATVSFLESSLNVNAKGSRGEVGLMQVHGPAAEGCDLDTSYGQLSCGSGWLRKAYDICGNWKGALMMYATGECKHKSERINKMIAFRYRKWQAVEKM